MSSDLIEYVDYDLNESTVALTMKASGDAFLYADGDNKNYYHLPPNETGWKNAEIIAAGLIEWVRHTKQISNEQGL